MILTSSTVLFTKVDIIGGWARPGAGLTGLESCLNVVVYVLIC